MVTFLTAWLVLGFATLAASTDAYEPSALTGLLPFYLVSLALFCIFFVNWKGGLFPLALLSALYQATISGLSYLKYPLLYGSIFDTMFHFSVAQAIVNTGHVPENSAYFGFTTFHSLAAMISLVTGLPLVIAFKVELVILPALVQLAGFWIASEVIRRRSTLKVAILGSFIAFTFNYTSGPQILAAFLVILSLTQMLPFARTAPPSAKQEYTISLLLLTFAIVITHHQTAFFTIFAFIGIGLLLPAIKGALRTAGFVVQRIELVGLLALGFGYIWWTYYAGFIDVVRTVFSIISGEPLGFHTTVGGGISFYGPLTWAYRTVINYAQRGQLLVWTTIGFVTSGILLLMRRRSETIDADTHAVIFSCIFIFLGVYIVFLFVPFFVIGSDRFFRFISFVSPPFIAIGMETVYSLFTRLGGRLSLRFKHLMQLPQLHMAITFLILLFLFVELLGPLLLGEVSAASSEYQYTQIVFLNGHASRVTGIVGHAVIENQFQTYAPDFDTSNFVRGPGSVSTLYSVFSTNKPPPYSVGALTLLQKEGPAGAYFEAVDFYSNTNWVSPALASLMSFPKLSLVYNSGEAFDAFNT